MVTIYGSFPGVQVSVAGGGITSVAVGDDEKLVLFGAAEYQNDGSFPSDGSEDPLESSLDGSLNTPVQINARREADNNFGSGSELADGMREALANGANIDFIYGVAPTRVNAVGESATQSGTLNNAPIVEDDVDDESNIENITFTDSTDGALDVVYTYDAPSAPSAADTVEVNPHTGEYTADASATGSYTVDYKYLEWNNAFTASAVQTVVGEDETAIYNAITEADSVSSDLDSEVGDRRSTYQLINALSGAEPNDDETITTDGASLANDYSNYQRTDARFDTSTYSSSGNQSIDSDYYFKFAPVRQKDSSRTILGGIGGLFAGNELSNPIYNDEVTGYDELEQTFTKTDADNMRDEYIIPVRQAGSIRVKDNLSTSTSTDWERDFWRRRIADRVILIAKEIGDTIIGEINDETTRDAAARLIRNELRELVDDRLLKPNEDGNQNWFVDVYPDSSNVNEVNIDVGFTPFGIVKRVDESITINT